MMMIMMMMMMMMMMMLLLLLLYPANPANPANPAACTHGGTYVKMSFCDMVTFKKLRLHVMVIFQVLTMKSQ